MASLGNEIGGADTGPEGEHTRPSGASGYTRDLATALKCAIGPYDGAGGTSILDRLVLVATVIGGPEPGVPELSPDRLAAITGLRADLVEMVLQDLQASGRVAGLWRMSELEVIQARALTEDAAIINAVGCSTCRAGAGTGCRTGPGNPCRPHKTRITAFEKRRTKNETSLMAA